MDILPGRRKKDKISKESDTEQIQETKHLVKIGSIKPKKGHSLFKVIDGKIIDVIPEDFIESRAILHYIAKDGSYRCSYNIKMRKGHYVSALNKINALKQI